MFDLLADIASMIIGEKLMASKFRPLVIIAVSTIAIIILGALIWNTYGPR
jgi:hypothetical protein